jgi:3-polyprenyl-4-hydroxybenzoate decarboxylase
MDLRQLIDKFKDINELRVIEGADWELEIVAISYLTSNKPDPPALLFDNIPGYKQGYRVLSLPSSPDKRINLILGLPLALTGLDIIRNLRDNLNMPLKPIPPIEVKEGPVTGLPIPADCEIALAALGQHSYNRKFVIVVDDDIDPTSLSEVM